MRLAWGPETAHNAALFADGPLLRAVGGRSGPRRGGVEAFGPAETLAELTDGEVDAIFLDADKTGYVTYLEHSLRLLRPGGVLMADNVLAGGRIADGTGETEVALRAFLDAADATSNMQSVVVPLGDGIFFGVKSD